jgi:SHS2 domain-containing protein
MSKDFEIINHTADIGIKAYGANLPAAFVNAAIAMYSLITDPDTIKENLHRNIDVSAPNRAELLVEWLNELIYFFDAEQVLFKRFDIDLLSENRLKACCYGEKVDKLRHDLKRGIKSATYHMIKVEQNPPDGGYQLQILFDV